MAGHANPHRAGTEARQHVLVVRDNGRGIPVDPHPKFKNKSALEVIIDDAACRRKIRRQGL